MRWAWYSLSLARSGRSPLHLAIDQPLQQRAGHEPANAERRQSRVIEVGCIEARREAAVPDRHYSPISARILDCDLGAQFIHAEPLQEIGNAIARRLQQKATAKAHDEKLEQNFCLR